MTLNENCLVLYICDFGVLILQAVKLSEIVELAKTVSVDVQFELPI